MVDMLTNFFFFFFKQKTAYEFETRLEFRRVLFRSYLYFHAILLPCLTPLCFLTAAIRRQKRIWRDLSYKHGCRILSIRFPKCRPKAGYALFCHTDRKSVV